MSWIGHFYFERNKPASFRYPLVGFYAGFMWFFIRTFELIMGKDILKNYRIRIHFETKPHSRIEADASWFRKPRARKLLPRHIRTG
ncbi:Mpo1-like protein [Ferviditalea candida]|uniref:Mpo1-like protein n=1 Tax=Ferviditalea candida TaxID=3108399 RepID=A0ABU5ZQ01_9BACL|nr:Mpo1-like protein [Paenibacillaceae bacterium T2]